MLHLFYAEPDLDRWFPLDRFPRRVIRRLLRGPARPGGQMRVFLNLCAGLDAAGQPYSVNDYKQARRNPGELCCLLGKRHVLDGFQLPNPLMVGPCCHNHPLDEPGLAARPQVRRILVPGEWMRLMCAPAWGEKVHAWPVGIDTERWRPDPTATRDLDFIFYNKIRWDHAQREETLLTPLRNALREQGLKFEELVYGKYRPEDYHRLLARAKAMLFLCEHETQGLAYQEALSSGVPVLAWDHGGEWLDPAFYPDRVRFGPVSSVPYWSDLCGEKFADAAGFPAALKKFLRGQTDGLYRPRDYILSHLGLKEAALAFAGHAESALAGETA